MNVKIGFYRDKLHLLVSGFYWIIFRFLVLFKFNDVSDSCKQDFQHFFLCSL